MADPLVATIEETVQLLAMSRSTVNRRIRDGKLAAVRDGGITRVPRTAIADYLAQNGARSC